MEVDPDESNWVVQHNGEDYYFCSDRCQKTFLRYPVKYTEMRHEGHGHSGQRDQTGGCCGGGIGVGWYSYIHLAIMILFIILLLFR